MTPRLICICMLLPLAASAQEDARRSPFMPKAAPKAAPKEAAPAEFEFNGAMSFGGNTRVCITNIKEKKSHWIAVGSSADGIEVVSHDPEDRSVQIRQGGRTLQLALKQAKNAGSAVVAAFAPAAPAPVSGVAGAAGVAESVAVTDEEKEREARFLVSDLLEIGMIQRKAYEEAKRKKLEEERAKRADAAKSNR